MVRCKNPEIAHYLLESWVFETISNTMTDPAKLKKYLIHSKDSVIKNQELMELELKEVEVKIITLAKDKRQVLNSYATGKLSRTEYVEKCLWYDNETDKAKLRRKELIKLIPTLHKTDIIDVSLRRYCETVKARFEKCGDYDTKRQFVLDYVKRIILNNCEISLQGEVPIKLRSYEDPDQPSEASKINFLIKGTITSKFKHKKLIKACGEVADK